MTNSESTMTGMDADGHEIRSDIQSLKRLWALAGPLRSQIVKGIAFRFAQSFCLGLGFGTSIKLVTDLMWDDFTPDTGWALQITALAALSLVGQIAFSYLAAKTTWMAAFDLGGQLRLSMLDRLRQLPLGFHLSRNRGDTVTMLTSDMQSVENFMSDGLPRIAEALGMPVAILVFLAFQDGIVALAALASIVIAIPVYLKASRHLAKLGIRRQDMQAAAAARMIEFVQGIAVIRAFNRVGKGAEDFKAALETFRNLSVRMVMQLTLPLVCFGMILMLGVPLVLFAAGWRWLGGEIDAATAITACMLIYATYSPLLGLLAVMENTRMADASLTRIDRILSAPRLPEASRPREPGGFDIAFDNVRFGYRDRAVVDSLSFRVPERTMTAIVGPSGAGKSTILNLIPRFWDIDGGAILIGGVDIRQMSPERLASLITVVFQDVYLFSGTIFDNIAFGCQDATREEVEDAARAAQAHAFITDLPNGYQTRVGEGGASLSGGQRQRISIARAILKDAPIVLLDEATAAIDPTNEKALQAALAALVAHKTLIVVAHKLSTVQAADEILVLDEGRIVERGVHDDLVGKDGIYAKLWRHWREAANWHISRKADPAGNLNDTAHGNEI
ncbi:ABC transporter ATP-binding protein [Thalassospira profundimaris]|uniref:ABC transporter ATP-binding protein n=1 Tax=Thalassospira profundimaris TaxID=502049 RepID=UPI001C688A17|nr:ABC transporter ATP-binding protein [Thalassospira profundimaris]